jgi:hypothetical protein
MLSRPTTAELIDGIQTALINDLIPELQSDRARTIAVMVQTMLQCIVQKTPLELQLMAAEHNDMARTLRDIGEIVGESEGAAADRIRRRAQDLGGRAEFAPLPAYEAIFDGHRDLSQGLVDTLDDLDELIRDGKPAAETALQRLRQHLGPRTAQEFGVYVVGAGMAGRG